MFFNCSHNVINSRLFLNQESDMKIMSDCNSSSNIGNCIPNTENQPRIIFNNKKKYINITINSLASRKSSAKANLKDINIDYLSTKKAVVLIINIGHYFKELAIK